MNFVIQISEQLPALSTLPVVTAAFLTIVAGTGLLWALSRKADFAVVTTVALLYAAVPMVLIWTNK